MDKPKNTGSDLTHIKKNNPFIVPEGYFEDFSSRVSDKIHANEQPPLPARFTLTWKPYLATAVIVIAALLAGNSMFNQARIRKADRIFHAEVSRTVEEELHSISEETILEVMKVNSFESPAGSTVNSEEVMEYLMNVDLNETDLLNTL